MLEYLRRKITDKFARRVYLWKVKKDWSATGYTHAGEGWEEMKPHQYAGWVGLAAPRLYIVERFYVV